MTRTEFLNTVQKEGIIPDIFNLDVQENECFVLDKRDGWFDVYYSERGFERGTRRFATESAALDYLLEKLRADPTTKRR